MMTITNSIVAKYTKQDYLSERILDGNLPHHEDTPSLLLHLKLYEPSNPIPDSHFLHLNIKTSLYAPFIIAYAS